MGKAMGRRREARNRHLERYVKVSSRGYVSYKHPKMKKAEHFGTDWQAANEVARIVNARLSTEQSRIERILSPDSKHTFSHVLKRFEKERIPDFEWSKSYKEENLRKIKRFREHSGDARYQDTDVLFFTSMVEELFSGVGQRFAIILLRKIDEFAVGKGLRRGPNVANGILMPKQGKRQRRRIKDYSEFKAIREHCPSYLQDAIDFALITLQPRQVLCMLDLKKHVQGDKLRFKRGKTGVHIEITINAELDALIQKRRIDAMKLGTKRLFCRQKKIALHNVAIDPNEMSADFTKAAKACGLYPDRHPTLHEVRSLGARLYEERGFPKGLIQALMGHKEAETTEIYLNPDEPKYIKAKLEIS